MEIFEFILQDIFQLKLGLIKDKDAAFLLIKESVPLLTLKKIENFVWEKLQLRKETNPFQVLQIT